jgi:hypothetical protein
VGIDGTGSRTWMKPDGSNSHVYMFVQDFQYGAINNIDRKYFHGPSDNVMGRETEPILQNALDFIKNRLNQLFSKAVLHDAQPLKMFDGITGEVMKNCCNNTRFPPAGNDGYTKHILNSLFPFTQLKSPPVL